MEILRLAVLLAHVLSFSVVIGTLVTQAGQPTKRATGAMRAATGLAIVTGLALVALIRADDGEINNAKIAVKFAVAGVLLVATLVSARRPQINLGVWAALLALAVGDVGVALFWSPAHGSY